MLNLPFVIQNVDNQLFLKAIFALAVYAFLRIGEITTKNNLNGSEVLQVSNVSFNAEDKDINGLSVVITNYKHSDLHAKSIFIPLEIGNAACPVKAVHNYLSTFGHTKGSFFQFRCGSPVTHYYFTSSLKSILMFIGLDPKFYKGHRFRIGAATSAAARGIPLSVIQNMGRWKSDAVMRYIRMRNF